MCENTRTNQVIF